MAALTGQPLALAEMLHTLGHDSQPKSLTQTYNGSAQRRVLLILGQIPHESAIDLEPVYRQLFEIGKGGVPRTKIIHRNGHAKLTDTKKDLASLPRLPAPWKPEDPVRS
nr:hypothetical protein [Halomonas utahensis]